MGWETGPKIFYTQTVYELGIKMERAFRSFVFSMLGGVFYSFLLIINFKPAVSGLLSIAGTIVLFILTMMILHNESRIGNFFSNFYTHCEEVRLPLLSVKPVVVILMVVMTLMLGIIFLFLTTTFGILVSTAIGYVWFNNPNHVIANLVGTLFVIHGFVFVDWKRQN